jgi:hypothetical protein
MQSEKEKMFYSSPLTHHGNASRPLPASILQAQSASQVSHRQQQALAFACERSRLA